jgi:hypothetical protein
VNEKIEGFFDVCRAGGLTGDQGVLVPASNVKHLMLRADVVEAAGKGLFHVWPVATVDEAVELLTGVPAGEKGRGALSGGNGKPPRGRPARHVRRESPQLRSDRAGVERREGDRNPKAAGHPARAAAAGPSCAAPRA